MNDPVHEGDLFVFTSTNIGVRIDDIWVDEDGCTQLGISEGRYKQDGTLIEMNQTSITYSDLAAKCGESNEYDRIAD